MKYVLTLLLLSGCGLNDGTLGNSCRSNGKCNEPLVCVRYNTVQVDKFSGLQYPVKPAFFCEIKQ